MKTSTLRSSTAKGPVTPSKASQNATDDTDYRRFALHDILHSGRVDAWTYLEKLAGSMLLAAFNDLRRRPKEWRALGEGLKGIGTIIGQGALSRRDHWIWRPFEEMYGPFRCASLSDRALFVSCMAVIMPRQWSHIDSFGVPAEVELAL